MYKFIIPAALTATALLAGCAGTPKEATVAAPAPAATTPPPPQRSITQLAGDVYRWQDNQHFGVVLVTDDGIVIGDPINVAASEWLKGELATRFPGKQVKYVLYSHHHFDHASGGAVFADARVISQADTKKNLQPPAADSPVAGFFAGADTNKDGKLQKSEVAGNQFLEPQFDNFDADKNGEVTNLELFTAQYVNVRVPDGTYKTDYTLNFGGQSVHMISVPNSHASDMSYIVFPGNILFVVDVISIKRLPFGNLQGFNQAETDALIDKAVALNPAIFTGGHGGVGGVSDLQDLKQYFVDLTEGVKAGIAAGKSLEEIQKNLTLDKYKAWDNYEQFRAQNIAGMYAALTAKS